MTPELYASLSDDQVIHVYLAQRDRKGRLIPEWKARRRLERSVSGEPDRPTGDPRRAGQELPSMEDLEIPPDVLTMGVPMAYVSMFWSVWKQRGVSGAEIRRRFLEQVRTCKPRGR